jgi:hypothetical protein
MRGADWARHWAAGGAAGGKQAAAAFKQPKTGQRSSTRPWSNGWAWQDAPWQASCSPPS